MRTEGLHHLSLEGDAPHRVRPLALCGLMRWAPGPGGYGDPLPWETARAEAGGGGVGGCGGHFWSVVAGLSLAGTTRSQTQLFTLKEPCPCPARLLHIWVPPQRTRKFSSGSGKGYLVRGARHLPLLPLLRGAWDRGPRPRHRVPGRPGPRSEGGRGCRPAVGQPPRTGSVPCLCCDMAAAEATPPRAPGEPWAARWASQAACTLSVPSAASLEGCWRPAAAGPRRLSVPPTHPAHLPQAFKPSALPTHRA